MINLSEPFIRRPVMTTLCVLAIIFFGVLSFLRLPVSNLPPVEFPTIEVAIVYPGADPITISNNVVTPLEQQFTTIDGIQTISSTSYTGNATIVLQFVLDRSMDAAATDVLSAINAASHQLPPDLPFTPTYVKTNPTETPILVYAITSDTMLPSELYRYAYTVIGERINILEGVSQVKIYGAPYAVRIQVDPQKLASRDIGLDEFGTAVQNQNVYLPTGTLFGPKQEFTIDCKGQITQAEEYNNLIIKNANGLITRISDVGEAKNSLYNDKYYTQYLDKEKQQWMVALDIQKQGGANTLELIEKINAKLDQIKTELPGSINVNQLYSQEEFIVESVKDVEMTLLLALGLVVFVIFFYLGKPVNTLIPSLAIPVSILGTLIAMKLLGYNLDILSLMALTLAIGFLVDDAIVVLENIVRNVEHGLSPYEAALTGSRQICFTILSMTICLCMIFIPLVFMAGIIGRILHEFAMTIVITVMISGVVSLTFTSMLCSRYIGSYQLDKKLNWIERISQWLNNTLLGLYKPSLKWCLRHQKTILGLAVLSLVGSILLIVTLPKDFLPPEDIGLIQGFAQAPDGTSPDQSIAYAKQVQEIVNENPYVAQTATISAVQQDNQTLFFIHLTEIDKRPSMGVIVQELTRAIASQVVGVQMFLKPLPLINLQVGAVATKADYQYTLQSLKSDELYTAALKLEEAMKKLPQLTTVTNDLDISQPQLHIEIQRDKASLYGVSAQQIEQALSLAYGAINLSPINEPDEQYYVMMETLPKFYADPQMLSQLWIRSSSGDLVALTEVVTLTERVGPLSVNHLNALPSATISFDLAPGAALGDALSAVDKVAKEILPASVFGKIEGAADIFKESFANLNFLLLITFFIIYVILGILYENFLHPITVMSTLPPAALGGLITLVLFNYSLSLYAFVGLIMLLGIVMKNGIIMVDFASEGVEKEGKGPFEAIYAACTVRFRPILMTTFAATMGAVPIALGIGGSTAESRRPLGVVIVGGLIFSQILTLYLTPVIYLYVERLRERMHGITPVNGNEN